MTVVKCTSEHCTLHMYIKSHFLISILSHFNITYFISFQYHFQLISNYLIASSFSNYLTHFWLMLFTCSCLPFLIISLYTSKYICTHLHVLYHIVIYIYVCLYGYACIIECVYTHMFYMYFSYFVLNWKCKAVSILFTLCIFSLKICILKTPQYQFIDRQTLYF